MQALNFEDVLTQILARDPRYHREAYYFLREALDFTQKLIGKQSGKVELRHVAGQKRLEGIRQYGLQQFGPLTMMVLNEWGVHRCEDFGELVFRMVEHSLLAKTESDSRVDFQGGYDFHDAFRRPFMSAKKPAAPAGEPKTTRV